MTSVVRVVFTDRKAVVAGLVTALAAAILFVVGGQMLGEGAGGPVLLVTAGKAAIFAVLAVLVGIQMSLQSYALRLRLRRRGAGAGGFLFAFLGASCCTPLIWPALLSFLGVSGVTLLGINSWLHQWFWLPVLLSAAALGLGLWRTVHALTVPCSVRLQKR